MLHNAVTRLESLPGDHPSAQAFRCLRTNCVRRLFLSTRALPSGPRRLGSVGFLGSSAGTRRISSRNLWSTCSSGCRVLSPSVRRSTRSLIGVLDSAVRMELRRSHRLKRGQGRRPESLDADTPTGPLRDAVPQDAHSRRTGATSADRRDEQTDRDAIQAALDSLPDNLRGLSERLMEIGKTRLAAELGISPRQVGNLIEQILPTLVRAGFGRNSISRTERDETA